MNGKKGDLNCKRIKYDLSVTMLVALKKTLFVQSKPFLCCIDQLTGALEDHNATIVIYEAIVSVLFCCALCCLNRL